MSSRIDCQKTSIVFDRKFDLLRNPSAKMGRTKSAVADAAFPAHPMKTRFVWAMPVAALVVLGNPGSAFADTSDVKGPAPVIVAKSGEHCKDDPNCFNRIHYAVKPVAHVQPGQHFILETRDGLDSDLNFSSTAEDVAAVDLNRCHPLTGPVYIEGAKKGDSIAVTVLDIVPDEFGTTTVVPGFKFCGMCLPIPTSCTGT